MQKVKFIQCISMLIAAVLLSVQAMAAQQQPNVIMILIDDMGWADSSTYGSEYYQTPNLTRLAQEGMLFTDAYAAAPLCSPTRASIMSGQYPARLRITKAITPGDKLEPRALPAKDNEYCGRVEGRDHMPLEIVTIAERLRDTGYNTAHIGKWHLTPSDKNWNNENESFNAEHQGFDFVIGGEHLPGPTDYYSPYLDTTSGRTIRNLAPGPEGEYLNERLAEESIKWIESVRDSGDPFYLNFWHYAVHGPIIPKKDLMPKYIERRNPDADQRCPEYATMIDSMDNSIGILLNWLDKPENKEIKDNTLILLTSDNGGVTHREVDGNPWTSNRPLRGGKANTYEGGSRVPWLVRWNKTPAGTVCNTPVITTDIYPTLLELAGLKPNPDTVMDGRSIVALIEGKPLDDKPIFVHFPHNMGLICTPSSFVRDGDWKLIRFYWAGGEGKKHYYELFNLKADPMEAVNLATYYPEKVSELDAIIDELIQETDALIPTANPDYKGDVVPPLRGNRQGHSKTESVSSRPETLRLERTHIDAAQGGSKIIQLVDQNGKKRKTAGVLYKGEQWVTVENRADGSVKVTWDRSEKNGPAEVLFGWSGGSTTEDVNGWTMGPYVMEIK